MWGDPIRQNPEIKSRGGPPLGRFHAPKMENIALLFSLTNEITQIARHAPPQPIKCRSWGVSGNESHEEACVPTHMYHSGGQHPFKAQKVFDFNVLRMGWCPGEDSNLHGFHHWYLKPARLPIPPPGQRAQT